MLVKLGFRVTERENLERQQMLQTIHEFSKQIAPADVALLYYSGHGLSIKGTNYLVPTDAFLSSKEAENAARELIPQQEIVAG